MKESISVNDYAGKILEEIPRGVFFSTQAHNRFNTMTIGWGSVGVEWGKPIFTAYIREGRFTKGQLDKNPEFTISVPLNHKDAAKLLGYCGSHSGRDTDKLKDTGITLEDPEVNSVPGIKEAPLTLECNVIYTQMQDYKFAQDPGIADYYPQDVPSTATGSNKDNHLTVIGEIVNAYIIK